ncbi:MAG: VWA domain-containing protein [Anaerolineales bacterium]|nr:VWA domain-containing protein [Anaerolineales bacterium]MCB9172459.1 VWA domain-containing protein [Ardenticatenales bacterium]
MKLRTTVRFVAFYVVLTFLLAACGSGSAAPNVSDTTSNPPLRQSGEVAMVEAEMAAADMSDETMLSEPTAEDDLEAPDYNTEEYDRIYENPFLAAQSNPLSTFSIDVDTASYSNSRRFINSSQLPPPDAVRIEEFINYFDYDYPQPDGEQPFSVNTELSVAPWNPSHYLVQIGIQGVDVATEDLPPSNLVFLLDVSGSMNDANKLPLVKQGFRLLVDQLTERDRVAIVVYAGSSGLVLPPTSGADKATIMAAIDNLDAGGSTAGGEGIQLAYDVAQESFIDGGNNRVVLATDGDFNVGPSSDGELVRLIEEKREAGVFLSILGFGTGNYKDSKMEQLADKGNGNYAYIDGIREAEKVLVSEMAGTLLTIAKDVKIQVEFNPAKVQGYRLIGFENRLLAKEDFNDDTKDAGELGAGHTVTALYELVPVGVEMPTGVDDLIYQESNISEAAQQSNELMTVKLRYKQPDGDTSQLISQPVLEGELPLDSASDDFRFAAAVAEFGMLLRDSEHKGTASFDHVLSMAEGAKGPDLAGYRAEFITLVQTARLLSR